MQKQLNPSNWLLILLALVLAAFVKAQSQTQQSKWLHTKAHFSSFN